MKEDEEKIEKNKNNEISTVLPSEKVDNHLNTSKMNVRTKAIDDTFCERLKRRFFGKILNKDRIIEENGKMYPISYMSNKINNCRYNLITFLPLFLYYQFRSFSNLYFLMMALLPIYPPFRVYLLGTALAPLVLILFISFCKEFWDEQKKKAKDTEINKEVFKKLTANGIKKINSEDIKQGDLLIIEKNKRIPADIILLHTKNKSGTCFVRTDQLDGETDWKVKEAVKITQQLGETDYSEIIKNKWKMEVEAPNDQIYNFNGSVDFPNGEFENLRLKHALWANMKVVSGEIVGVVIYSGKETRMEMNNKEYPKKAGKTENDINFNNKVLFCILFSLSFLFLFLSGHFMGTDRFIYFVRIFMTLSYIIPMSMKVNVDFAKLYYSALVMRDKQILNTLVRNSDIPEELGRVEYLLSDKTGTLTKNEMIFQKIHTPFGKYGIQTKDFLKEKLHRIFSEDILDKTDENLKYNFLCFLLCNNVSPSMDNNERILQASSPDEIALVEFSESMGFYLTERTINKIKIKLPNEQEQEYEILFNFPFNSETKKMGIIVKNSEKILFFLKGADNVIQTKISFENKLFLNEEANVLSNEGLRILALTYKELSVEELDQFISDFKKAGKDMRKREEKERLIIEGLEVNMNLLGISGVEDLLQEDIKSCIVTLREAGIRVWMLTGDKLETAMCIARNTGFKKQNQNFCEISSLDEKEIAQSLKRFNHLNQTLIVNGPSLEVIFKNNRLREKFFTEAEKALSVVLCRCAPKQKTEVALYLKNNLKKIVCAIGDGGNDVGMIQSGNVGIGIEGKEGRQASLASDFSVVKFKNIIKLFLWHGRLSYVRTALLVNFVVHRGVIIIVIQILFMSIFYYVSINIYNGFLTLGYSTVFTCFPIFSLILDHDIPIVQVFNYPVLYHLVQKGRNLCPKVFFIWMWRSVFQGSLIILLSITLFKNSFLEISTITFTSLIFIEYLNLYTSIRNWHYLMTLSIIFSLMTYIACWVFLKNLFHLTDLNFENFCKIFFIAFMAWFPLHLFQVFKRIFFPSQIDKVIKEASIFQKRNNNKDSDTNKIILYDN